MSEALEATNDKISAGETFKKALHLGGTLFMVTAITGVILGFVQWGTQDAIKRAELAAKNEALQNVMPDAQEFKAVDIATNENVTDVQEGLDSSGKVVGHCISVNSKGYGGAVSFIVGITRDGTVRAINILSHSETPGLGAKSTEPAFYGQFENKKSFPLQVVKGAVNNDNEIAAISGATITSNAVTSGVNAAVEYWSKNLKEAK